MNQNYWLIILFVATMVCNGKCRPHDVDSTNIHSVYRSEKQLEVETANRYEKHLIENNKDDISKTYTRINVKYPNSEETHKYVKPNSSSSVSTNNVKYVPVPLTVKNKNIQNVKKWPSDQHGIETLEDLSLYNIYTNNIKPMYTEMTTNRYELSTSPKPSIIILEELIPSPATSISHRPGGFLGLPPGFLTFRPTKNTTSVFPINVEMPPPYYPVYGSSNSQSSGVNLSTAEPEPAKPSETTENFYPVHPIHVVPPVEDVYHPPTTESTNFYPVYSESTSASEADKVTLPYYNQVPTTVRPETSTSPDDKIKCLNISIIATNAIYNSNELTKEGCQDISIHIETKLNNSNIMPARPALRPVYVRPASDVGSTNAIQSNSSSSTGIYSVLDAIWTTLARIFNFIFLNSFIGYFLKGFHNLFPGLFFRKFSDFSKRKASQSRRHEHQNQRNDDYLFRLFDEDSSNFKRRRKVWQSPYGGSKRKKISSPAAVASRTGAPSFDNKHRAEDTKLNIESFATIARASNDGPSIQTAVNFHHLTDSVSQMVDSDRRTPPKLKEIIKEKNNDRKEGLGGDNKLMPVTFVYEEDESSPNFDVSNKTLHTDASEGKASTRNSNNGMTGIAVPVMTEDDNFEAVEPPKNLEKITEITKAPKEEKRKNGISKIPTTTTPSSGLSTWILLSDNKDVTTAPPKKSNKRDDDKKLTGTTTKKPPKIQATTIEKAPSKKTTAKPVNVDVKTAATSALEAMVKNQKKTIVTTAKPKTSESKSSSQKKVQTELKKKVSEKVDVAETKDKFEIALPDYRTAVTAVDDIVTTTTEQASNSSSTSDVTTETSTKKKKSSSKKKKKNKNKKKPVTGVEAKVPSQEAVGSQIYNFISREIVPTVGLGLIGVALTAGLASFLGYNPFVSTTVPLRRTYETNHGYSSNNYYNYNTDYSDGGQSEEALLREVLSGMPEESRYGLTHSESSYSNSYHKQDQAYDSNPSYSSGVSTYNSEKDESNYDSGYSQDYSYSGGYDNSDKKYSTQYNEKYPVYTRETGTSFVYPETTGTTFNEKSTRMNDDNSKPVTKSDKYANANTDAVESQSALYTVSSDGEQYRNTGGTVKRIDSQNNWHRIGTPKDSTQQYSRVEPGPRSLDLSGKKQTEVKSRSKRAAETNIQRIARKIKQKGKDSENEVDFEGSPGEQVVEDFSTTEPPRTIENSTNPVEMTVMPSEGDTVSSTEDTKDEFSTESYPTTDSGVVSIQSGASVMEVLKRLAQFKLRLGLNFLRSTTDLFSKYLDDIQKKVDETFPQNTTTVHYNRKKSPWSRIFFRSRNENSIRKRRSALEENPLLMTLLTEEGKFSDRFPKSTKKDLKLSNKMFHSKKSVPKKYESRGRK